MRVRQVASAVVVVLALSMAGCVKSAPEITDEQVAQWRVDGEQTIPLATDIVVEVDHEATMASSVNLVFVTAHFASFGDLKASEEAAARFDATVTEQADQASVTTTLVNDGSDAFTTEVTELVRAGVPGLEDVKATSRSEYRLLPTPPELSLTVYLYVTDTATVTPDLLDEVSTTSQRVASAAGGHLYSVVVLPADAIGVDINSTDLDPLVIPLSTLDGFMKAGAHLGCVRTDSWAFDVSDAWAIAYPASEPGGACA